MNHLADKLKDSSPSITLSTVKVFIKFIDYDADLHDQVMTKVKTPLISLVAISSMEMRYVVITHINNLIQRGAAKYFADSYKSFFCLADDPSYIQSVKMDILVKLANQENLIDILNELGEYSSDIDQFLSCLSIKTFGRLGYKFAEKVQYIVKQLSYFVKINKAHLIDDITIAFKLILSSSSNINESSTIYTLIGDLFQQVQTEQAKIALIWILGEHGGAIELAPYYLENLVKDLASSTNDTFTVEYKLSVIACLHVVDERSRQTVHEATPRNAPLSLPTVHVHLEEHERRHRRDKQGRVLLQHASIRHRQAQRDIRRDKVLNEVQREQRRSRCRVRSRSTRALTTTLSRSYTTSLQRPSSRLMSTS